MIVCACRSFGIGSTLRLIKALKEKGKNVITVVTPPKKLMKLKGIR